MRERPQDIDVVDGGAAPPADAALPAGADQAVGRPAGAPGRRLPWWAPTGWAVAVVALLLAGMFAWQWAGLRNEAADREQVRRAAERLVLHITTFEGERIEEWVADLQARSTGEYAREVADLFDQDLRDSLREFESVSRGELQRLYVQDLRGDEAEVFAIARQTINHRAIADPIQDELRMEITLLRVDGRWLAARVAVLAPSGMMLPGPTDPPEGP